jgi:hypothetical protein
MRDKLETQIIEDSLNGDTTILAEILTMLTDKQVLASLVDEGKDNDDTRDLSIKILDELVKNGHIKDCIDTDDETEFSVQDIIHLEINKAFNISE